MPRLDHRIDLATLAYDIQMLLSILVQEINVLRQEAELPPRTPQQIRQAIRQYTVEHPRPSRQGG